MRPSGGGNDSAKVNAPKVLVGRADEVWERGAIRKVNRISELLRQGYEFAGPTPGWQRGNSNRATTGAFPYGLGHSYKRCSDLC